MLYVGKQYKLTFNVSNYSLRMVRNFGGFTSGVLLKSDGYYDVYGTAASTTFGFSALVHSMALLQTSRLKRWGKIGV